MGNPVLQLSCDYSYFGFKSKKFSIRFANGIMAPEAGH